MFLRRIKKSKYLRLVNFIGLTVIFSCLLISMAYIKKEYSYDRFHSKADRIFRISIQNDNDPVDGRFFGIKKDSPIISDVPAIEDAVYMQRKNTGLIEYNGKTEIINDFYAVNSNFFEVFDYKLLQGEKNDVINAPGKVVISSKYAAQLFGEESPIGKELKLSGRQFEIATLFITGVFEDFPENTHFHTDLLVHLPANDEGWWNYVYLLLYPGSDINDVEKSIAAKMDEHFKDSPQKESPYIMPLTDIHLHSRVLRELEHGGNINYIYLIAGANILLLIIVLFNLWLNAGLIFSFNRKYYQLLRLNGASSWVVVKDESLMGLVLGITSILAGCVLFTCVDLLSVLTLSEVVLLSVLFLIFVVGVSLLPVFTGLSETLFKGFNSEVKPSVFSLNSVKYPLIVQYGIVMFIVIISFGITKQINLIKTSQVGGNKDSVLVLNEQPDIITKRLDILKDELLKHPEIKMVTTAFQLPGDAIRDMINVRTESESESEGRNIPLIVAGDDFLPFFDIRLVAGTVFQGSKRTMKEEEEMFYGFLDGKPASSIIEEYVINQKAARLLGFNSPEESIGKILHLNHQTLGYINKGVIVGVTGDFNYTTTFEETFPLIILQRKSYQSCLMVQLSSDADGQKQAIQTFNEVWNKVNPDYSTDYTFLHDVYNQMYYNELNAEMLTRVISLL